MNKNLILSEFIQYFKTVILVERSLTPDYLKELHRKLFIIDSKLGFKKPVDIDLFILSQFLNENTKTPRMFNQYRSLFHDLFVEMMDNGIVMINIAKLKKLKKYSRTRNRLTVQQYRAIYQVSPAWLQIAMALSLQTSHGRHEIVSLKYADVVNGYLRIARKKTQNYQSSFVEIPVSQSIQSIISNSRDDLVSPFVVHTRPLKITQARLSLDHWSQITPEQLTRRFKAVRDSLELFDTIEMEHRPTFHEIRALSIWLGERAGHDMKARAGHSDRKMTERYLRGHEVQWNRVDNIEIES
jgi:integrase